MRLLSVLSILSFSLFLFSCSPNNVKEENSLKKYFDAFSEKNPKLMNKFMKLPGFKAIKLKALYLYDVLRFKDTDIDQDPDQDPQAPDEVIEQKIEQKNEQESLEDLIKKNEEKEKIIEDKKQKIRLNNNKRKFRKRKPKP